MSYNDDIDALVRNVTCAAAHLGLNIQGLHNSLAYEDQDTLAACRQATHQLQAAVDVLIKQVEAAAEYNATPQHQEVEVPADFLDALSRAKWRSC
jgi:hypothetical protein